MTRPVIERVPSKKMSTWHKLGTSCVCVFVCVCVCDMLMMILGTCWTTFIFMCKLSSQLIMLKCCNVELQFCQVLMLITGTCWTTFVFMSMLKSHCLWLFVMLSCHAVMLSYVKCLCWLLGHAEQLSFSCLCSKVPVYSLKLQWFFGTSSASSPTVRMIVFS